MIRHEAPLVDGIHGRNIIRSQFCSIADNHGTFQDVLSDAAPAQPAELLMHAANRLIDDHLKPVFKSALALNLEIVVSVHLTGIKQRFEALPLSQQRALAAYILNQDKAAITEIIRCVWCKACDQFDYAFRDDRNGNIRLWL